MADIHNYHAWNSKYPGYFTVPNVVNKAANILWNTGPKFCYIYVQKNFENDSKISKPGMVEQ